MNASAPQHPTDQILYAYGLGRLGDHAALAVDSHLEACDACRQRVSELSGDSFVGRLRDAGARPDTPAAGSALSGGAKYADGPSSSTPVPSPDPDLAGSLPPELADNSQYQILRELGRGGMGVVYLVRNTLMDRLEVLKVLNKEMLERKGTYDRFLREVRAAARLNHLHVVGAYSAVQVGALLVFAMEYVEGADLAQLVKSRGPLPVAHACSFAAQAALGLQHAHDRGMVHRDIKPANLILMRQGQRGIVKILDFGLAKATSENPIDGGLTREGQMLGTPLYISPEQTIDAQNADIRADIYSLGCTLYYLLTGDPPFDGKSLYDILQAHQSMEARPLNLVRPEVPVELAVVVEKMMAKERERRYQTPAEVAEALKPFFKPKVVGSGSSDGERSQPGQQDVERTSAGVVSPACEPAGAAPVAAPDAVVAPNDPALMWKSLVAIPEPEHLSDARPPAPEVLRGRPPWLSPALAVGVVLLLGLVVGWAAGVFKVKTEEGDLVFSGLPEHAVVTVDGKVCTVEWPGGKGPAKVTVPVGEHRVKVELNGLVVHGEEVKIATGEKTPIRVRLEPHPAPPLPPPPPQPPPWSLSGGDSIITNSIEMKLVLIPAGEFLMGSPASDKEARGDEKPQHRVRITRPFYLGVTEVTQGQYRAVTVQNPSKFKGSDDLPVELVTWNDAIAFCEKLSDLEKGKLGGVRYRLPTEAEWEYACRAGSTTRYSFGDDAVRLGDFAWYDGNSGGRTHPVGKKWPNAWGLYDMHGNVWERCQDWYGKDYYGQSPGEDPLGPSQAATRVCRGGGWYRSPRARSAYRYGDPPASRIFSVGFRVARVQSEASPVLPSVAEHTVNPPAPAIEEKQPAPTVLVPDAQPTPAPEEAPKTIKNSIDMKLVLIPAGEFLMGSPDDDKDAGNDEKPQHRVRITRPFYLGVTEVTQGQYQAVTGQNPSKFKGSDELPVEMVTWNDAIAYCDKLSALEKGQLGGARYRLPTEAEWEYACRGGRTTRYSFSDDGASLGEFSWFSGNAGWRTHKVAEKRPNAFGLYDMHGNVREWCWDAYDADYYGQSPGADPLGPSQAAARVRRGGSWSQSPRFCRSASRIRVAPGGGDYIAGFRVARVLSDASPVLLPVAEVIVNPSAPPIDEKKPAPPALVPDAQPTPASEEAPKTSAKKSTGPGTRRKTSQEPKDAPKLITNSIKMKLVLIPAGEFSMGSPAAEPATNSNEKPQHKVRITRSFYMGATEVTQGQYRTVMGRSPSKFTGSDDLPVETVSWNDAIAFCDKLSEWETGKLGGRRYRLPTEAEWEYACRAGSTTRFSFGDDPTLLGEFAWYKGNSEGKTHPVGQKRPNAWGLYDMYGNVWERCWDGYEKDYYGRSPAADPLGSSQAAPRLNRGGSWGTGPNGCRSANRGWFTPGEYLGFRVTLVHSGY